MISTTILQREKFSDFLGLEKGDIKAFLRETNRVTRTLR